MSVLMSDSAYLEYFDRLFSSFNYTFINFVSKDKYVSSDNNYVNLLDVGQWFTLPDKYTEQIGCKIKNAGPSIKRTTHYWVPWYEMEVIVLDPAGKRTYFSKFILHNESDINRIDSVDEINVVASAMMNIDKPQAIRLSSNNANVYGNIVSN